MLQKCWIQNQYKIDQPSLAMMTEIKEQEIRKQSMDLSDKHNLRL